MGNISKRKKRKNKAAAPVIEMEGELISSVNHSLQVRNLPLNSIVIENTSPTILEVSSI